MKCGLAIALFLSAFIAHAEEWRLIWVAPGATWFVKDASGELQREGESLYGTLQGTDRVSQYAVRLKIKNGKANGTFIVVPSDATPLKLYGTYEVVEAVGENNCREVIQLKDGQDYVGLSRIRACKP